MVSHVMLQGEQKQAMYWIFAEVIQPQKARKKDKSTMTIVNGAKAKNGQIDVSSFKNLDYGCGSP